MTIDAYGLTVPVTDAAGVQAQIDIAARAKEWNARLDPEDPDDVQLFIAYGRYTASSEIGMTGSGDRILDTHDGEIVGLYLLESESASVGLAVDPLVWRPLRSRSRGTIR